MLWRHGSTGLPVLESCHAAAAAAAAAAAVSQRRGVRVGAHAQRGARVRHPGRRPGPPRPHPIRLSGRADGRHLGAGARKRGPRRAGRAGHLPRGWRPAARPVRLHPSQRARQRGTADQRPARRPVRQSRRGRLRRQRHGQGGRIPHGARHRERIRGGAPRDGEHQRVAFVAGVRRGVGHRASVQLAARTRRRHEQRGPRVPRRRHPGGHQSAHLRPLHLRGQQQAGLQLRHLHSRTV